VPEFSRCVAEAQPTWFLMENVPAAPTPTVPGYCLDRQVLNNRWLGEEQNRSRQFCFGTPEGHRLRIETRALEAAMYADTVISDGGRGPNARARLRRGLPAVTGMSAVAVTGNRRCLARSPRPMGVLLCA